MSTFTQTLGFVGAGRMATALARGCVTSGLVPGAQVIAADPSDEALQGLVALGYSVQDAAEALKKVDTKLPPPERIKAALKS